MADAGYTTYSTMIVGMSDYVKANPDVTKRFVEASIIGWYNYLYGDNAAANALIRRENPDIGEDKIAYAIAQMKQHGIVDSGDSLSLGIGAMTEPRMQTFFETLVRVGIARAATDWRQAFDPRFVNKGIGRELRKA